MKDDLKIIEPPECPSEDACIIVNSFLDDSPTEFDYFIRIENIKRQILDSDFLVDDLTIQLNTQKEESKKLRELLYNNYNECWRLYGKYKHESTSL